MKKTLTLIAACIMAAAMAKAESEVAVTENSDATSEEFNISTAETDMSMLESKNALLPAPEKGAEKDAKYWAQGVLSRVKVLGYAQAGYTASFYEGNSSSNTNTFDMKRAVIMLGADIAPHFYAFFMHEFKNNSMQEYYMEYRPFKALNFRLGQSKIEYTMANPLSPRVLESISCSPQGVAWLCGSDPLMGNGSGRDMGLMVYGDFFKNKFHYVVEVVNGGQINSTDKNNQKNVIAKLEYKPIKNLRISASGQLGYGYAQESAFSIKQDNNGNVISCTNAKGNYNNTVSGYKDAKGVWHGETYHQDRWAAGFEWMSSVKGTDWYKNRCTLVRCEVLGGRDGGCHSFGGYGAATIPVYKQLDVVAQADYFNYNTDMGYKQTNLTAGVQYWVHTKNRIQLQYTYSILSDAMKAVKGGPNYGQLMAQVQLSF